MAFTHPIVNSRIIAHRGASGLAPENTLVSVTKAAQMGASWVETDVRLTADMKLVMVHDETLDRTTNGRGAVLAASLDQIKALDAGKWFSPEFSGAMVPTLEEYLECVVENNLNLQLELKEVAGLERELVERVAQVLKKKWPFGERGLYLSAFSERCLRYAGEILPGVARCLALVVAPKDPKALMKEVGCQIIHIQDIALNTAERYAALRASGVEFGVATIDDALRARQLLELGAQSILSNDPGLLVNDQGGE
ncbi:Glycerophosphoryl diester phosphodiesterase [hydrothermal vent metagenome]|uniref:Glycerophosphoryl diester phosphodiesterase n=1 Tax=hydrothermal vent metagenome TaxID=652676 RepID=A0A3B0U978_9ZZZZ